MLMRNKIKGFTIFLIILFLVSPLSIVSAESKSTNYQLEESAIGTSDSAESSSTSFTSTSAAGALSVGDATSTTYNVSTGTKTTPDPYLSFTFIKSFAEFDTFSPTLAATSTASFSVADYTSYGYSVQLIGSPLSNGSHTITSMSSTDISKPGIEQFGINLVANTSPSNFGANPDNGLFGFGEVTGNYSTPDSYRFVSGESIAIAPKSSGITIYTISYIVNVASITPGGQYSSDQTLIVTGTY